MPPPFGAGVVPPQFMMGAPHMGLHPAGPPPQAQQVGARMQRLQISAPDEMGDDHGDFEALQVPSGSPLGRQNPGAPRPVEPRAGRTSAAP